MEQQRNVFHIRSAKRAKYICGREKQRGRNEAAPNDSKHNGTIAHATSGGQGRKEGRKCSYYNLHCHFNKLFLIHGTRFK